MLIIKKWIYIGRITYVIFWEMINLSVVAAKCFEDEQKNNAHQ